MKKVAVFLVVSVFFLSSVSPAHAHRRRGGRGGTNWGAVAGLGIIGGLLLYTVYRRGNVQEKGIDEEYRTQRYKIDADTTLAAPSALGDRESSEWSRPVEGQARIYSPLPVRQQLDPAPPSGVKESVTHLGSGDGLESYASARSEIRLPDISDLDDLYRSLNAVGATKREFQALLHGIEEVRDTRYAAFSRSELREDLNHLQSLKDKVLSVGAPVQQVTALERLIHYLESVVFGKGVA